VATVDLKIPAEARKEFDNASKSMAGHDLAKALQKLNRAIALYPQYLSLVRTLLGKKRRPQTKAAFRAMLIVLELEFELHV